MLHWMRDDEEIGCWAALCTLCSASNFLFYCNIAFAAHLRVASGRGKLQRIEFHHPLCSSVEVCTRQSVEVLKTLKTSV